MTGVLDSIKEFFGCSYATPVGSGTVALRALLKAIDAESKKVILPALCCPNVLIAVSASGAIPVVVDVSETDGNISIPAVSRAMDDSVRAVIAIDSFGYAADVPKLCELTSSYDCVVIDDACQAYGGRVEGEAIGGRGDVGLISFGYAKPIELMGGGLILTNSKQLNHEIDNIVKSWSMNFLTDRKNEVVLRLLLKDRFRLFRVLDRRFELLEYSFPSSQLAQLPEAWSQFQRDAVRMRQDLMRVRDLMQSIPEVRSFAYTDEGWLSWRYSFRIPDSEARVRFGRRAQEFGLSYSRLYPPVDSHFKNFPGTLGAGGIPVTRTISADIVNLKYEVTIDGTQGLVSKVSELVNHW